MRMTLILVVFLHPQHRAHYVKLQVLIFNNIHDNSQGEIMADTGLTVSNITVKKKYNLSSENSSSSDDVISVSSDTEL